MIPNWKIYPRSQGHSTVYLQNVVTAPFITVGDHTTYDDFVRDPRDFQRNQVLYHYPECNHDPADHREILLHCLRRKIPVQRSKPCAREPVDLSVPHLL